MNDGAIRIGTVTAVNAAALAVRVHFPDVDIVSDWLPVLRHRPGVSTETADGHKHGVVTSHWIPSIGDPVLCIYMPGFNADGYVLGGIA